MHVDFRGGETTETRYSFQYVSESGFAEHGWVGAEQTPEAVTPPGGAEQVVSATHPSLTPGETYRYRLLATSSSPGVGVVEGSEQMLVAPLVLPEPQPACPNTAFRVGLSAQLPDCRAYEQLSPVDKHGAQEPWQYDTEIGSVELRPGERGDTAVLDASPVSWEAGSGAGGSPYLFSRVEGSGWQITAGSPQPETGLDTIYPKLYSADLTQVALEANYSTSPLGKPERVEYRVGPVGGPYTTVASVPPEMHGEGGDKDGWVAANGGFSKLVFATQDRTLLGEGTGTRSGSDLYEYTGSAGLRQLNVAGGPAATIGSCGAQVVDGPDEEGRDGRISGGRVGGPHAVSADGSRVFFEAVPSSNCSAASHLYMRVGGSETVDLGVYKLMGANAQGTRLLVQDSSGALLAYDTETRATTSQSASELAAARELQLLGIPDPVEAGEGGEPFAHPRYTYWGANPISRAGDHQAYRYDSVEHVMLCISCASPSDPSPKQPAFLNSNVGEEVRGGVSNTVTASADGRFAFFTTPAALVPEDVDGETSVESPSEEGTHEFGEVRGATSPSSDVYEWRAGGVDGCLQVQGCVALVTDGLGGYLNLLLGTADEGRDVFFYTRSTLVSQIGRLEGTLGEGNIYDARIGGGFAPAPPRPTECEGSACSSPPPAPIDATPSSLTFQGVGNLVAPLAMAPRVVVSRPKPKPKPKSKPCRRGMVRRKGRCVKVKRGRRATAGSRRTRPGHRTGSHS